MNEVLFRVIREDNKEIIGYERIGERGQWEHIRVNRDEWLLGAITYGQEYSKFIRQQFTGFVIKTSPEIKVFVGDKVLVRGTKRVGLYETTVIESPFGFTLKTNKTSLVDGSCLLAISKVIGNIHES